MSRFVHGRSCVYNISYHIVWIPKKRRRILTGSVKQFLEQSLIETAKKLSSTIVKYEIMPDHVHIFIKCPPTISVSKIVKNLKGRSAYDIKHRFVKFRTWKAIWTPSYYCESIGHISEETIKKYIDDQWKNLQDDVHETCSTRD